MLNPIFIINLLTEQKKIKCFFSKINENNFNFDLRGFINNEISSFGIKNIENIRNGHFFRK